MRAHDMGCNIPKLRLRSVSCPAAHAISTACICWPVGYNNIDIEAAQARGVPVCTSPGYNAASVAEGAIMMMLMLARRVHEQQVLHFCFCCFLFLHL